jgi:triosephosphate isomerase
MRGEIVMRTPIAAGNWKMNYGPQQASEFVGQIREGLVALSGVATVLLPPFISLSAVQAAIVGTPLQLGAQNCSDQPDGAFTGEVSVGMIAELCQWVIIGHSERRRYYGETDDLVNRKTRLALAGGLQPIVCVGEQLADRDAGRTTSVITTQVRGSLAGLPPELIGHVVIAYEPVWAIGAGHAAMRQDADEVVQVIRSLMAEMYGSLAETELRVLYGGSVTAENISGFMASSQLDGALVGGASLQPEFVTIAQAIAAARGG